MEEVDQIIIPILRQIGCAFPEDVESIAQFQTEHIVFACSTALRTINPAYKLPKKLPDGKAARFRICTDMAGTLQQLGYTGDIGYENFLYPNEKDMRQLLIWLVGKLPKHEEEQVNDIAGQNALLTRQILHSLQSWGSVSWNPLTSSRARTTNTFHTVPLIVPIKTKSRPTLQYYQQHLGYLPQQVSTPSELAPSVLELNISQITLHHEQQHQWDSLDASGGQQAKRQQIQNLISSAFRLTMQDSATSATATASSPSDASKGNSVGYGGAANKSMADILNTVVTVSLSASNTDQEDGSTVFSRRTDFSQEKEETVAHVVTDQGVITQVVSDGGEGLKQVQHESEDEIRQKREQELGELQQQLKTASDHFATLKRQIDAWKQQEKELEEKKKVVSESNTTSENEYKVKKQTLDLLPQAEANLKQLAAMVEQSKQRLLDFQNQWEEVKAPYIADYNRKKQLMANRKEECRKKLEEVKRMREEMKEMVLQLREKEEQYKQVFDELNRLPKSINRQVYVKRIMDVVKNLDRQKADIKRILGDVRDVQKEINNTTETFTRSFALSDELIFKTAQKTKDQSAAQAYRYLVNLRDNFDKLIQLVEKTGGTQNELRDLASRIQNLEERNTLLNFERVRSDLEAVKTENAAIAKRLGIRR
eukprot:TRINITY_DN4062_c0_g2_i1.p1 TRINITY_DN4062_c0_g2~~TRINITY_DN4062_c0_g2_i1.p1  ORF type:complete len:673 (+),score=267.37 TRINITY_DN4062_c0_g2_i1:68-2020(+)